MTPDEERAREIVWAQALREFEAEKASYEYPERMKMEPREKYFEWPDVLQRVEEIAQALARERREENEANAALADFMEKGTAFPQGIGPAIRARQEPK